MLKAGGAKSTQREGSQTRQTRDRGVQQQSQETSTMTSNTSTGPKTVTASIGTQNNVGSQVYFLSNKIEKENKQHNNKPLGRTNRNSIANTNNRNIKI